MQTQTSSMHAQTWVLLIQTITLPLNVLNDN
jgi:hypothetical protein